MANNRKPKLPIQVVFAIILVVATIGAVVIAIVPTILPMSIKPTSTVIQVSPSTPTTLPTQFLTATSVIPTAIPSLTATPTMLPTDTATVTFTPTYTSQQLPDLTVTGISELVCIRDQRVIPEKDYIKFSMIVRNVGPVSTRAFGPFSILVHLILGQHRYSLEEWAKGFNGVISYSKMDISNLSPNGDAKLNVFIDLKGNTKFGIEVIANSGTHTIPESDTTNNTLIQGFSIIC